MLQWWPVTVQEEEEEEEDKNDLKSDSFLLPT
jgi:hypothetical protein